MEAVRWTALKGKNTQVDCSTSSRFPHVNGLSPPTPKCPLGAVSEILPLVHFPRSLYDIHLEIHQVIIPRYIIGFSGHRHLTDAASIRAAIHASLAALKAHAIAQGAQVEFYSSAAYGADLLALDCATELQIPIHLSLPLPEDEFGQDFVGHDEDWSQAQTFISAARNGTNGGTFRVQPDHHRSECFYAEATKLVDACDFLLTVWDGEKAHGLAGTAQVIDLAIAHQKPVLRISTVDPKPVSCIELAFALPSAAFGAK